MQYHHPQHIPYRNHPLTMLMSDSIGGNAKTLMFVNTSPADYNNAESNSSLAFASRCKDVTNQVVNAPGVQAAQVRTNCLCACLYVLNIINGLL